MKKLLKIAVGTIVAVLVVLLVLPIAFRGKLEGIVKQEGNKLLNAQFDFEKKCESCEILTIKNAKHSMLTGGSKIMKKHLNRVFVFFGG